MNDIPALLIGPQIHEQPPKHHQRPPIPVAFEGDGLRLSDSTRAVPWRPTILLVLAFWTFWFCSQSAYNLLNAPSDVLKYAFPRALVAGTGLVLSLAIALGLGSLKRPSLSKRATVAVMLALVGTVIHSVVTRYIWMKSAPDVQSTSSLWVVYGTDVIIRFWFFLSQSAIILAQSYASDIREREQRIGTLQALAHSAQLSALRNQLSPHFLFNALNSIAGLISAKRIAAAETMTENLADFLRQTLALDPQQLITLEQEMQLQRLYLDIEKARFPDRLVVEVDVKEDLKSALVPSLITQPLIENSIKYAVSRSIRPVRLEISARRIDDRLELVIRDNGGDAEPFASKGAKLGLRNVGERVRMHYGERGDFRSEADAKGGFLNVILVPLEQSA